MALKDQRTVDTDHTALCSTTPGPCAGLSSTPRLKCLPTLIPEASQLNRPGTKTINFQILRPRISAACSHEPLTLSQGQGSTQRHSVRGDAVSAGFSVVMDLRALGFSVSSGLRYLRVRLLGGRGVM